MTKPKSPQKYQFEYASARRRNYSQADGLYRDVDPGMTIKAPYDRSVYEYYRPNEYIPTGKDQHDLREIMRMCTSAYERVGVIRSVIDMMSEFGAEGIEIIHPDAGPNEFYKAWSKKVKLEDRAERFLNWLFKSGNLVARRKFGTIKRQELGSIKQSELIEDLTKASGRIPLEYVFYDPSTIELVGDSFAPYVSEKKYAVRIPISSMTGLSRPKNKLEEEVYNKLPQEIKDAIEGKTGNGILYVPIPTEKLYVAYYKKDDSDIWAKSFIYSILSDVIYNDKLKMAKTSALDNFHSVVRLWKLGDHTHNLPAAPDDAERLVSILEANTGGGSSDIIWNSAIHYEEHYPPIDKLVDFEENLHSILLGLGVPENLVGGKNSSSSSNNSSYLGLKNLIKRLEAGRRALRDWLETEISIINKEMGFRKRPIIRFDNADLHDEQTYFNLLVQLVDRGVISDQTILERINEIPEIEAIRVGREESLRENGSKPDKASPFHKPDLQEQQDHEIQKIREQAKITMKIAEQSSQTENSSNIQRELRKETTKNGRPLGSKDKNKRKRNSNRVKTTTAKLLLEANKIYDFIDDYVRAEIIEKYAVANVRKLTSDQFKEMDNIRTDLFACIKPFNELNEEFIMSCVSGTETDEIIDCFKETFASMLEDLGAEHVSAEEKRHILVQAYIDTWLDDGV